MQNMIEGAKDWFTACSLCPGLVESVTASTTGKTLTIIVNSQIYDVIIVGGRIAGLALAIFLQRAGLSVLILEKDSLPSDKAFSTHFVGVQGVSVLKKLNVFNSLKDSGCPTFNKFALHTMNGTITGEPPDFLGERETIGPRRYVIDAELLMEAKRLGASILDDTNVLSVVRCEQNLRCIGVSCRKAGTSTEGIYKARIIIGADGITSVVAKEMAAEKLHAAPKLSCIFWTYLKNHSTREVEFYFGPGGSGVCFQTNDNCAILTLTTGISEFKKIRDNGESEFYTRVYENCPKIADYIKSAESTPIMGGAVANFFRQASGKGWALVGDAACTHDPVSASGISDALIAAEILSRNILDSWALNDESMDLALEDYALRNIKNIKGYYDYWCASLAHQYGNPNDDKNIKSIYQNMFWESLRNNKDKKKAFMGILAQSFQGNSRELHNAIAQLNENF